MRKMQRQWAKIFGKFSRQTIGVLGDFMLDELLRGNATRISPEVPVPVVLMDSRARREFFPGGAGNVAANIRALGGRAIPFGAVGMDESGKQLCDELETRGIVCGTLIREEGRTTPRKLRIVAQQHQILRLDFERPAPISAKTAASLERSFARWVPKLSALIVSDYQKGSVQSKLCHQMSALARQKRIPVFVDPKPEHPEICRHATAVTCNLSEAELMAGRPMHGHASLEAAGRQLLTVLDCSYLLITRGAEGITLFEKGGIAYEVAVPPRFAHNAAGVRDVVLAVLALAFCSGAEMSEAAELANLAAGQAGLKFGTAEVGRKELLGAIGRSREEI